MAQKRVRLEPGKLCCPVCLELLVEPVTLPCGHSFCLSCIRTCWDGPGHTGTYSCPQCRKRFGKKPALVKNFMLAELVEDLKKDEAAASAADPRSAGAADVSCDVCRERKLKAVKSCLVCLASYCQKHLKPHKESPAFKRHQLVEPLKNLQENICPLHDEVMKIFCRTDQLCICPLCLMDQHKGHETVSAAAERAEKQKKLEASRGQIQEKIQSREKEVQLLQRITKTITLSADKAEEETEKIFSELISLIQRRSSRVKQQIRAQQEADSRQVRASQEKLQQEIRELKQREAELRRLSRTEDHNKFLQEFPRAPEPGGCKEPLSLGVCPRRHREQQAAALVELLQEMEWKNYELIREPESREEFLRFSQEITLDPNTAHRYLQLSERRAALMEEQQIFAPHPARFTRWFQVLSVERLSGRHYWEVKFSGEEIRIAICYGSIARAGASSECAFGANAKSWALHCDEDGYSFLHNKVQTRLQGPQSFTLGVYLDHPAGLLCFLDVSQKVTLLHRVQSSFREPLHAGVQLVDDGDSAEFLLPHWARL